MLPRFRLLQVGDIHLPSAASAGANVDDKDRRFPLDLKTIISHRPLKRAFEKIYDIVSAGDVESIIFMGDLTDFGNLEGYKSCASYIVNSLQIGAERRLETLTVGIVSGNHDIDRELARSPSNLTKFAPLAKALADAGLPSIPIKDPIWIDVNSDSIAASVVLMNSCWGCGSAEFIPEEFRQDVEAAIENAISRGQSERTIRAYYERQLDTPAFSSDAIQKLLAEAATKQSALFIAVAHHNLLPQRQTRLAPYTELVNSGALRLALQELGKPVVYLHGHIHQDPIEILQVPGGFPLVSIAAPEVIQGFNVLEFVFTRSGMPISCRVVKWRFDSAGYIRPLEPLTVPLIGQRRRSHRTSLGELYKIIVAASELYWSDLASKAAALYSDPTELEEDLELLVTDGRIRIENHTMSGKNWIIGAAV